MITVHLFGNERSLEAWLASNDRTMERDGWQHSRSKRCVYVRGDDRYMLIDAGGPWALDRLRGIVIDEVKVYGPYGEHLANAEDHARCCVRLRTNKDKEVIQCK